MMLDGKSNIRFLWVFSSEMSLGVNRYLENTVTHGFTGAPGIMWSVEGGFLRKLAKAWWLSR